MFFHEIGLIKGNGTLELKQKINNRFLNKFVINKNIYEG